MTPSRRRTSPSGGAPPPRVLVIGLDPWRVPGPWDPAPVAEALRKGLARFAEHGIAVETCLVGLDGSDDIDTVVGHALAAQPWECVVVGRGLRDAGGDPSLSDRVVELARRHAPDAAIAFNTALSDLFDVALQALHPDRP